MGFSVSGATVVLLVGLMVSLGTLYPVVDQNGQRYADAEDARENRALDRQNTDIRVVSANYTDGNALLGEPDVLTVIVRNTGTTALSVEDTDLLVDGVYTDPTTTAVESDPNRTTWAGGENLTLTVEYDASATAPDRVVVVTDHGVSTGQEVN